MGIKRGILRENGEQLKGHGAERWVHRVSDNMPQWLKLSRCQQSACFAVITVIKQKRRPVSTSHIQIKDTLHINTIFKPIHAYLF